MRIEMALRYYKEGHRLYALDEDDNLFYCIAQRGTSWEQVEECAPLEAVVVLGPNAFPKGKRHRWFGKLFGYVVINPFKALKAACANNGDFIMGSLIAALVLLMIGLCVWGLCIALYGASPEKTSVPAAIVVQYTDGTKIQYPIQNIKPSVVEVKKK
jgi:hypothetical protein